MSRSNLVSRVVAVSLTLEDGRQLRLRLGPESNGHMFRRTNHRVTGAGLGKYSGGEFIETTVSWSEPAESKLPVVNEDEVLLSGESYIPVGDV